MKLKTYCVVEESEGDLLGVFTFTCDKSGKAAAIKYFKQCIRENWGGVDDPLNSEVDEAAKYTVERASRVWSEPDGFYSVVFTESD